MSDYEFVARGTLKLKKSNSLGLDEKSKKIKKAKKKMKSYVKAKDVSEKIINTTANSVVTIENDSDSNSQNVIIPEKNCWMTEAQKKFLAQQEKRQLARVMEKASKTHKQRVEEFNSNLEKLSEHYDIPKVSWTK